MDRDILNRINRNARYTNSNKSKSNSISNDSVIRLGRSSIESEIED